MEVEITNTTYKNINYEKIKNTAYDCLKKYCDGNLPINLEYIINQIDHLHLMKYSHFASKHKLSIDDVIDLLQSEDGALWYQTNTKTYLLLYNDTITPNERIRFTIAHEIGHFILRHNEITQKTVISRYSLTDKEYNSFETEANFFAKHLLVPYPVLFNYFKFFNEINVDFIHRRFSVSLRVSSYILDNFKSLKNHRIVDLKHDVEINFKKFITNDQTTRICCCCNTKIKKDDNFCHICSTAQNKDRVTLTAFWENKNKEVTNRMRYIKYQLDENGYPKKCPKCENEELKGSYCHICGIYLKNICIGLSVYEQGLWGSNVSITHFLNDGCDNALNGNSRYCSSCGGYSSYYYQNLLRDWEIEKKEHEEIFPW